jgi:hypothetical protein
MNLYALRSSIFEYDWFYSYLFNDHLKHSINYIEYDDWTILEYVYLVLEILLPFNLILKGHELRFWPKKWYVLEIGK